MKRRTRPTTATLNMNASNWSIRYSKGLPDRPTQVGDDWKFVWTQDKSEIHYLTCAHKVKITQNELLLFGTIIAPPEVIFDHMTETFNTVGGIPTSCRFIIEKDLSTDFGRWFSNPHCVVLTPGNFGLTVSLRPENWSSVFGKFGDSSDAAKAGFAKALASPQAIGLVFGGGSFFGHGVRTHRADATFLVTDFFLA